MNGAVVTVSLIPNVKMGELHGDDHVKKSKLNYSTGVYR